MSEEKPWAEPRFKDCPDCKFFKPNRPSAQCLGCGIGENFEERLEELDVEGLQLETLEDEDDDCREDR